MKEKEVSRFKEYYQTLLSLADGLLWVDNQGFIVRASENFNQALGYKEKDLLQRKVFDIDFHFNEKNYPHYWKRLQKGEKLKRHTFFTSAKAALVPSMVQMIMEEEKDHVLCLVSFLNLSPQRRELLDWCIAYKGIAAWQWDLLRGSLVVTPSFYSLFQLEKQDYPVHRENIAGLLRERLSSEQLIWLTKALRELYENRQAIEWEFWFEWEGEKKNLFFRAEAVSERDQVIRIRGFFQQMEIRDKTEKDLLIQKKVFDTMTDMVCWLTSDCRFSYVNPATIRQLGYEKGELLKELSIMDIEAERTRKEWETLWRNLKSEKNMQVEGFFQRKNGSIFPVNIHLARIRAGGEVLVSMVARDISQQRHEETRLRRALVEIDNLSKQLEEENVYLQEEVSSQYNFENIISRSAPYKKVLHQVRQVAPTDSTVLIYGETGTGKELLARAIHYRSRRSERPLIKVDCGTLPTHLIESELFGHEKGAFTGAIREKPGRFELAHGGTLFLDEIGELPLELQPKLLRVLQEGEFVRVGGNEVITVDVRIIVATNRDLKEQVHEGKFRSDLYYRVNIFPVYNLPLRERRDDISLLAEHFLKKYNEKIGRQIYKIPPEAMEKLMSYDYPGNVRELESIIERAVILSKGHMLSLSHWDPIDQIDNRERAENETPEEDSILPFEEMQRLHILKALEQTNWKVSGTGGAAELLGLNPQTLYSKMRKLEIKRGRN